MAEPRAASPGERLGPGLVSAALIAWTVALFARYVPPFVDLPQHAHTLAILRDPAAWSEQFFVRLAPGSTNALWFEVDRWLLQGISVDASLAVVCALAVIALPLSLSAWARALGRDPALALLLAWWVAWNRPLYWGFFHYTLSLSAAVGALAVDAAAIRRGRAGARGVGLAALLCVVWLLHAQTWAFALLALKLQRLVTPLPGEDGALPRRVAGRVGPLLPWTLPSVLLATPWLITALARPEASDAAPLGLRIGLPSAPMRALAELLTHSAAPLTWTRADDALTLGLIALATVALGVAMRRGADGGTRAAAAVALAGVGAYLLMPMHILGQFYVAPRMAPWVLLGAVPLASVPLHGGRRRAALTLAALGAGLTLGVHTVTLQRFDDESAPARQILAEIPENQRVILWARTHGTAGSHGLAYLHFVSWYAAHRHGTTHFSFAEFRPNPVGYVDHARHARSGEEFRPWCSVLGGDGAFDYLVTRDDQDADAYCGALPHYRAHLELVSRRGTWALYRVKSPLPALGPCVEGGGRSLTPERVGRIAARGSTRCPESLPALP